MNFHGRSRISARHPEAQAICDRCGFCYSHSDLNFQHEYAGAKLVNTQMLVCDRCRDVPHEWTRGQALPLGPDPLPIRDPRPDNDDEARTDYLVTDDGVFLQDDSADFLIVRETGGAAPSPAYNAAGGISTVAGGLS